jgi:hypothetical protein
MIMRYIIPLPRSIVNFFGRVIIFNQKKRSGLDSISLQQKIHFGMDFLYQEISIGFLLDGSGQSSQTKPSFLQSPVFFCEIKAHLVFTIRLIIVET